MHSGHIWLIAGVILLSVVLVDLVWTALAVSYGAGPLTPIVLLLGWRAAAQLRQAPWVAGRDRCGNGVVDDGGVVGAWSPIFLAQSRGIVDGSGIAAGGWTGSTSWATPTNNTYYPYPLPLKPTIVCRVPSPRSTK